MQFKKNIVFLDYITRDQFGIDSAALAELNYYYHHQVDSVCLSGCVGMRMWLLPRCWRF